MFNWSRRIPGTRVVWEWPITEISKAKYWHWAFCLVILWREKGVAFKGRRSLKLKKT